MVGAQRSVWSCWWGQYEKTFAWNAWCAAKERQPSESAAVALLREMRVGRGDGRLDNWYDEIDAVLSAQPDAGKQGEIEPITTVMGLKVFEAQPQAAQPAEQERYCETCERNVTEPCNSVDCSTPETKDWSKQSISDDTIENIAMENGVKWNGDYWTIEDADLHPFVRTIMALETSTNQAQPQAAQPEQKPGSCKTCGNEYLASRTDVYKEKRPFIYCDCCGAMADSKTWYLTHGTAQPAQDVDARGKAAIEKFRIKGPHDHPEVRTYCWTAQEMGYINNRIACAVHEAIGGNHG